MSEIHATTHRHPEEGGWLRPAVFGAMDGLVSNVALIAGVAGAGATSHVVILAGLAGLLQERPWGSRRELQDRLSARRAHLH
jgi:NAD(P)H-dependent flavin oxidoreductase YrpB (nitropropane dioxygenase family)